MKTPITDAIWDQTKGIPEYHAKLEDTSKRLETDRAALMDALKVMVALMTNHFEVSICQEWSEEINNAKAALSAARANFPTT